MKYLAFLKSIKVYMVRKKIAVFQTEFDIFPLQAPGNSESDRIQETKNAEAMHHICANVAQAKLPGVT